MRNKNQQLGGGFWFTNPSEKYATVRLDHETPGIGVKIPKKYFKKHHLDTNPPGMVLKTRRINYGTLIPYQRVSWSRISSEPSTLWSRSFMEAIIMGNQPTPPGHVPPPEIAGLIKGLLTIGFP